MRFSIEPREGYLQATVYGRDTAEQMREFLLAVHAACRKHDTPKILVSLRQSRAVFKAEDYGLSGYANELVTPACQIALLGDTDEVNSANEYIEVVAGSGLQRARFRDEQAAQRWLGRRAARRGATVSRARDRGALTRPAGVRALWDGRRGDLRPRRRKERGRRQRTIRLAAAAHYYVKTRAASGRRITAGRCADPAGTRSRKAARARGRVPGRRHRENEEPERR
jgi:hypothetical protein